MYLLVIQQENKQGYETAPAIIREFDTFASARESAWKFLGRAYGFEIVEENSLSEDTDLATYWQLTNNSIWYYIYITKLVNP